MKASVLSGIDDAKKEIYYGIMSEYFEIENQDYTGVRRTLFIEEEQNLKHKIKHISQNFETDEEITASANQVETTYIKKDLFYSLLELAKTAPQILAKL